MTLLTLRLHLNLYQISRRYTSKIAVAVDTELQSKLDNNDLKPRQHPGIVKGAQNKLPTPIAKALTRAIGDHPLKALLQDAQRLNRFISARHPPPEKQQLQTRQNEIVAEVNAKYPEPANYAELSEEKQKAWQAKREKLLARKMAERTYAWQPISYPSKYEALVYAVGRGALEYTVLSHILQELQARDTHFKPRSYFDFGSGVGTGMWVASHLWREHIFEYFNVDASREMNDLSELLLRDGNENQQMTLQNVHYRQFLPHEATPYELVVSAYSLFELPSLHERKKLLLNLWLKCNGYLLLVEDGSRKGFELINEAKRYILGLQKRDETLAAHVFAPCAHSNICPRIANAADKTPCNFQLAFEPFIGENGKQAERQTTRYSYVVLKKGAAATDETQNWPRLVRPTLIRSKHVICRMCTANAKLQEIIFTQSKHGRTAFRCARASDWGDRLPIEIGDTYETETRYSKRKLKLETTPAKIDETEQQT